MSDAVVTGAAAAQPGDAVAQPGDAKQQVKPLIKILSISARFPPNPLNLDSDGSPGSSQRDFGSYSVKNMRPGTVLVKILNFAASSTCGFKPDF